MGFLSYSWQLNMARAILSASLLGLPFCFRTLQLEAHLANGVQNRVWIQHHWIRIGFKEKDATSLLTWSWSNADSNHFPTKAECRFYAYNLRGLICRTAACASALNSSQWSVRLNQNRHFFGWHDWSKSSPLSGRSLQHWHSDQSSDWYWLSLVALEVLSKEEVLYKYCQKQTNLHNRSVVEVLQHCRKAWWSTAWDGDCRNFSSRRSWISCSSSCTWALSRLIFSSKACILLKVSQPSSGSRFRKRHQIAALQDSVCPNPWRQLWQSSNNVDWLSNRLHKSESRTLMWWETLASKDTTACLSLQALKDCNIYMSPKIREGAHAYRLYKFVE